MKIETLKKTDTLKVLKREVAVVPEKKGPKRILVLKAHANVRHLVPKGPGPKAQRSMHRKVPENLDLAREPRNLLVPGVKNDLVQEVKNVPVPEVQENVLVPEVQKSVPVLEVQEEGVVLHEEVFEEGVLPLAEEDVVLIRLQDEEDDLLKEDGDGRHLVEEDVDGGKIEKIHLSQSAWGFLDCQHKQEKKN